MTKKNNEKNFQQLVKTYREQPIVLYVGAGSSKGDDDCDRGIPGWWGLLARILREGVEHTTEEDIVKLRGQEDPWDAADFVLNKMPGRREQFQRVLWRVIQDKRHYPEERTPGSRKYKLINGEFLRQNATLNAIVAFCGGISALVEGRKIQSENCYFVCEPNQRVRAVLTTNYDPFLEAASTSKYRRALLKPVAAYGSDAGTIHQIPVFHIHGYVPHRHQARQATSSQKQPFVKQLVLDRSSYLEAWKRTDVFGPTMLHQIHYLRSYTALFVGFSFSDEQVNCLLKDIKDELPQREKRARNHFALLSQKRFDNHVGRTPSFYEELGIVPITYPTPKKIPHLLGKLYREGLEADHKGDSIPVAWLKSKTHDPTCRKPYPVTRTGYWKTLLRSRLCSARTSDLTVSKE